MNGTHCGLCRDMESPIIIDLSEEQIALTRV